MKKIFWRVFVAFGVVLLVFTILIGLMFTRFNRTNIVGAYKQQLGDLADGVVTRTMKRMNLWIICAQWKILERCRMLTSGL